MSFPALRNAEGDLAVWRRSPLRPFVEDAFRLGHVPDDFYEKMFWLKAGDGRDFRSHGLA